MKLIVPNAIADAQLVSSSVPETDYGVWEASTTYWAGARVVHGHRIWESVQAGNAGRDPLTAVAGWWINLGPTNRWAMFDQTVGTETRATEQLTVRLAPGRINALVLLQVDAAQVVVTQRVGADVVAQRSIDMIETDRIVDWYAYFFEPIRRKDYVVITDLPVFGESVVEIQLIKNAGEVSCGVCVVGLQVELGLTLASPSAGINDYSRKTTDDFGITSLVRRDFSKRMGVKVVVENREVDRVFTQLAAARALPAVWVGDNAYTALVIYGWYRDFEVDIAYPDFSYCTLNIEGMI